MLKKVVVCLLTAVLLTVSSSSALDYIQRDETLKMGSALPAFALKDLNGNMVDSEGLVKKKVLLLAFWSIYCKACVEKFGALVKLRSKYSPESLEIISINTDGEYELPEQAISDYVTGMEAREKFQVEFPIIYDQKNLLAGELGIIFLPAIITVDLEGNISGTYRRFSEETDEEAVRGIEEIIPAEGLRLAK